MKNLVCEVPSKAPIERGMPNEQAVPEGTVEGINGNFKIRIAPDLPAFLPMFKELEDRLPTRQIHFSAIGVSQGGILLRRA